MKALLVLLVTVCLAALGRGQVAELPRIELAAKGWNFGEKEQGEKDEFRLTVRNTGKAPLDIYFAKVTCGCLEAHVETPRIEAGQEGHVLIRLDAAKQQGEIKKHVFIGSSDMERPRMEFVVEGLVHARIRLEPAQLDLGVVDPDHPEVSIQEVLIRDGQDIKLLGIDLAMPDMVAIESEAFGEKDGRHGYRLKVKPLAGLPRGQRLQVPFQLRFDDKLIPQLTAAVAVEAIGILKITPDKLDFGAVVSGETGEITLTVEHRGGKAFKLVSLRALDQAIVVEANLEETASRHVIKLRRKAEGRGAAITSRFYLVTDQPEQRMLTLPITGSIVPKPKTLPTGDK